MIPKGIFPVVITGRSSNIVLKRCSKLGIVEVHQGVSDKLETLMGITVDLKKVAYIGDDINDLSCMIPIKKAGGLVGCPRNASKKILKLADFIAEHDGGDGAVRDFIDWVLKNN